MYAARIAIMTKAIVLALLIGSVLPGCSAETESVEPTEQASDDALTSGSNAPEGLQPAVGYLRAPGHAYAAALIGPHTVVTACHVVHNLSPGQLAWRPAKSGARTYSVTRITCHNKGTNVNNVATYDIATLELSSSVSETSPLGITSQLPQRGETIEVWGTGCEERSDGMPNTSIRQHFRFGFALNKDGDGTATQVVCPGDSGGPYVWGSKVFAVVHDWHHRSSTNEAYNDDTFARIQQGW